MQILLETADGQGLVTAEYAASWAARPRVVLYQGQHFEQNRITAAGQWVYRTASPGAGADPAASDPLLTQIAPAPPPPTVSAPLQAVLHLFDLALTPGDSVPIVVVAGLRDAVKAAWPRG